MKFLLNTIEAHDSPHSSEYALSRRAILCSLFLLLSVSAFAHPHMFFSSTAEFVWNGSKLSGFWLEWTMDEFFSADLIHGFDHDMNGKFSPGETEELRVGAFVNLKNYYYFTFIRQGPKRSNPASVTQFSARQKDGRVIYRFYVDLAALPQGDIAVAVYDYTFFCDVSYPAKDAVRLSYDPAVVKPSFEIAENRDYPVYYNPLGAIDDTTVYYSWKKGLQTYYPREIRITYEK
jgi:ABC-type uncharacterized transport system substrate-binding protein